jgi:penicillin amidase
MQGDMFDANAATFVPYLTKLDGLGNDQTAALDLLRTWDFQARSDSAPAAIFEAFWRHFLQDTFNDDLPKRYWPDGGSRWNEAMRDLVKDPANSFWDDKATKDVVETRDDIIRLAFVHAVKDVQGMFGNDPAKWNWGTMHAATFRNLTLGESGVGPIEALFNRGPFPVGGGEAIVDATGWSVIDGYETNWLPSMRMIVDLSNLNNSVTVHTTGESGHAFNSHYADMTPLWSTIQYYPMQWGQASVTPKAEGHLRLLP